MPGLWVLPSPGLFPPCPPFQAQPPRVHRLLSLGLWDMRTLGLMSWPIPAWTILEWKS